MATSTLTRRRLFLSTKPRSHREVISHRKETNHRGDYGASTCDTTRHDNERHGSCVILLGSARRKGLVRQSETLRTGFLRPSIANRIYLGRRAFNQGSQRSNHSFS